MIDQQGFASINFLSENKKYFFISVEIQENGIVRKELIFINKSNGKMVKIKVNLEDAASFYYPVGFDKEENMIFIAYSKFVEKDMIKYHSVFKNNFKLDIEGNPVLIYAKIPEIY